MDINKSLTGFFTAIENDARINTTHIGIYAALLRYSMEHDGANPIAAFSYEVMRIAKVSAQATYHKSVKDLHAFGYIRYEPSFKRNDRSRVYLLF